MQTTAIRIASFSPGLYLAQHSGQRCCPLFSCPLDAANMARFAIVETKMEGSKEQR
jgi:hypothetical protein